MIFKIFPGDNLHVQRGNTHDLCDPAVEYDCLTTETWQLEGVEDLEKLISESF